MEMGRVLNVWLQLQDAVAGLMDSTMSERATSEKQQGIRQVCTSACLCAGGSKGGEGANQVLLLLLKEAIWQCQVCKLQCMHSDRW